MIIKTFEKSVWGNIEFSKTENGIYLASEKEIIIPEKKVILSSEDERVKIIC